jgi:hypothetical protein
MQDREIRTDEQPKANHPDKFCYGKQIKEADIIAQLDK